MNNEEKPLVQDEPSIEVASVIKTPNSYKYPLLKKYFEFGPWIGRNRKALCVHCKLQTSSSQPDRLIKHLNKCNSLGEDDKVIVADLMNERTANKRKRPATSSVTKSKKNAVDCSSPHETLDKNSQVDLALTRFIIHCKIPLKAIHSREFVEFCRSLNSDYHIPSRETITNDLIPSLLNIL